MAGNVPSVSSPVEHSGKTLAKVLETLTEEGWQVITTDEGNHSSGKNDISVRSVYNFEYDNSIQSWLEDSQIYFFSVNV